MRFLCGREGHIGHIYRKYSRYGRVRLGSFKDFLADPYQLLDDCCK